MCASYRYFFFVVGEVGGFFLFYYIFASICNDTIIQPTLAEVFLPRFRKSRRKFILSTLLLTKICSLPLFWPELYKDSMKQDASGGVNGLHLL